MLSARILCIAFAMTAAGPSHCLGEESSVVETLQGPVKGYISEEGNYFEFFGIPYATAPKGDHKFKAPLEPPTWTNILESNKSEKTLCHQSKPEDIDFKLDIGPESEDCLHLNVFVPNTNKKNLPVIVHVHGGGFHGGAGHMFYDEPILRHDVMVVSINYRLGSYGFLCLGTEDIPGNAGMKDQVAALRWVKRNIANFGGNPDDVTINGGSAGSAAVEHLMLSPMAKGLFTKVIAESGSALSPWAFTPDPIALAKKYMYDLIGTSSDDINEIEKFYKSLTAEQLNRDFYYYETHSKSFAPCIEPKIPGEESFYNVSPLDILKSGDYNKIPFMVGFASEEGLLRTSKFDEWQTKMEHNFADFLPRDLEFRDENEKNCVAAKVKKLYFKDLPVGHETIKEYVEYFSDVMFAISVVRSAKLHALNSVPVYLYEFPYIADTQMAYPHDDKIKGASHCSQSSLVHKMSFLPKFNYSENDLLMQERLVKMWTDFAKTGTPVTSTTSLLPVAWDRVHPDSLNYMRMDLQFESMDHLLGDRHKFWEDIYRKYYRKPVAPSGTVAARSEL